MALPKRKISRTRRDKRRTHWVLKPPGLVPCKRCERPKRPHTVCPNCGHYKGEKIVDVEEL